jgi:hypothetical protein
MSVREAHTAAPSQEPSVDSNSWLFTHDPLTRRAASEIIRNHAEAVAAERFAASETRRLALADLKSEMNSISERVRGWEKLHGLRLPTDPEHSVLPVIARATGLTLAQVRDEQRLRSHS